MSKSFFLFFNLDSRLDHPLFASEIYVLVLTEVASACVETIHSLIIDELRMARTGLSVHMQVMWWKRISLTRNDFFLLCFFVLRIYIEKDKRKVLE